MVLKSFLNIIKNGNVHNLSLQGYLITCKSKVDDYNKFETKDKKKWTPGIRRSNYIN